MSTAVQPQSNVDHTDLPYVVRAAVRLGVLESIAVLVIGLVSKYLDGLPETLLLLLLVPAAILAVSFLPGLWTRARTIEGIAGAAGIGLAATVVFMAVDVSLFQPFGLYTHRWRDLGGGSNWWYHPVWWMVGTYLPWMGGWILAGRAGGGSPNVGAAIGSVIGAAVLCTAAAVLLHFPGASWGVGTFGVAFLPGFALATGAAVLGARRK